MDFTSKQIYDERDIIFSRNLLQPTSEEYELYYGLHPERKAGDDLSRSKPGLLSPASKYYDPIGFPFADQIISSVEIQRNFIEGIVNETVTKVEPEQITTVIKKLSKKMGAHSTGICELLNYHLYSHSGRGKNYGNPIDKKHKFAIAFTFEMDEEMVKGAPYSPIIMESSLKYLQSAITAVNIAAYIRKLGYSARAHIDGAYQVICPLVARDAGLGEIGRMGILMTPNLGPRVRISVITTDLPLETDKPNYDSRIIDFCEKCKKCAVNCPAGAISFESIEDTESGKRWQIKSDKCFSYWCTIGTDCGKCMSVCPYSHSNNFFHNSIRQIIKISPLIRKMAVLMDDIFYGTKPASKNIF